MIEKLAELEHKQWEYWSKSTAKKLEIIYNRLYFREYDIAKKELQELVLKWKANWKPYNELNENTKKSDRMFANKVLEVLNENH